MRGGFGTMPYPDFDNYETSEDKAEEYGERDGSYDSRRTYRTKEESEFPKPKNKIEEIYSKAYYAARGPVNIDPNYVEPQGDGSTAVLAFDEQEQGMRQRETTQAYRPDATSSSNQTSTSSSIKEDVDEDPTNVDKGGRKRRRTRKHTKKSRKHRK